MNTTDARGFSGGTYYRHSGEFGIAGLLMALAAGSGCAVALAFPYSYAAVYIPVAFFIVPFLYGGVVGLATAWGAKYGKVRNAALVFVLGLTTGAVAEYAGWVTWVLASSGHQTLLLNPARILEVMRAIAPHGAWSVKGYTPTGAELWALWLLEAVILMGTAAVVAMAMNRSIIFCEQCQKWCEQKRRIGPLTALDRSLARTLSGRLEKGDFAALLALEKVSLKTRSYTAIEIRGCDSCQGQSYLTVKTVTVGASKEDEKEKTETEVVDRLAISAEAKERLLSLSAKASPGTKPVGKIAGKT